MLSIKQRREIYLQMLDDYQSRNTNCFFFNGEYYYTGFCYYLQSRVLPVYSAENYPELYNQGWNQVDIDWQFNKEDIKSRISAIKIAINRLDELELLHNHEYCKMLLVMDISNDVRTQFDGSPTIKL